MRRFGPIFWLFLPLACGNAAAQFSTVTAIDAAERDAESFALCHIELDAECVIRLTDFELRGTIDNSLSLYRDAELLRTFFGSTRELLSSYVDAATSWIVRFDVDRPREPFELGERLYTFVPYFDIVSDNAYGRLVRTRGFLLGISENDGKSWRFVKASGRPITADEILSVLGNYDGEPPPEIIREEIEAVRSVRTRYLLTTWGGFDFGEDGASYSLEFDVRRKIRSAVDLQVLFDDPSDPGNPYVRETELSPGQQVLTIESPEFAGFELGEIYEVVIYGNDAETGDELFEQRQPLLFVPTDAIWQIFSAEFRGSPEAADLSESPDSQFAR